MRFSPADRLTSKKDFQLVFANSNKVTYQFLLVLYRSNQKPTARLGIIISKQYVKRAVERNYLRRIIRESFRQHKEMLKGLDIVVLIRSECTPVPHRMGKKVLRSSVDTLWSKVSKLV